MADLLVREDVSPVVHRGFLVSKFLLLFTDLFSDPGRTIYTFIVSQKI